MTILLLWDGRRCVATRDGPLQAEGGYDACVARALEVGYSLEHLDFIRVRDGTALFRVGPRELASGYNWQSAGAMPEASDDLRHTLLEHAHFLGFPLAGITAPHLPSHYTQRFDEWLAAGAHGALGFMQRGRDKRVQPELVMADAKAVLVLATPYSPVTPAGDARIARYAVGTDYHLVIPKRLAMLRRVVHRDFAGCKVYVSSDTGPVLERAYAEQAGLGWIGKNGNLLSRDYGSYLFLATFWVDRELERDAPHEEFCGTCVACIDGCPTQAIVKPGWVEATRCLPYWNIEHRGDFPPEAPKLSGWLFGCDICQEVCPWNRFAQAPEIEALRARPGGPVSAAEWVSATSDQLEARVRESAMKRSGAVGLKRNALRILS